MNKREYYCKVCDFFFERVPISEEEEVKCPLCGNRELELRKEEEKKPASCDISSKYT